MVEIIVVVIVVLVFVRGDTISASGGCGGRFGCGEYGCNGVIWSDG